MKLLIRISTAACMAAMVAASPAGAVSLTIGGGEGSLLRLGGSGDSSSSGGVSVSVGSDGDSGSDASIGLDAGVNADLDVNGGDNDLLNLFGTKKLITTGGEGDNLVTVDTNDDADALITLFGQSDGGGGVGIEVDLLDGGGTDSGAGISLFGEGQPQGGAAVAIDGSGSDNGVIVSLFGAGAGGGDGAIGGGGLSEDPALSLFGAGAGDQGGDDIETGSVGSAPAPASGAPASGAGVGGAGGGTESAMFAPIPPAPARIAPGTTARVATRTTAAAPIEKRCFSPDEQQVANLLGRSSYDATVAASWQQAAKVSIVSIDLCDDARARLAAALQADANIKFMRSAVAANAKLMAELDPSYDPENVLAVDKAGENVTVYVY